MFPARQFCLRRARGDQGIGARLARLLAACLFLGCPAPAWATPAIPNVDITIIRLDYLTRTIKGSYQLTQPLRKAATPDFYVARTELEYRQVPALDFGLTSIRSYLTGQEIARAGTVWMGQGTWEYPASPLNTTWQVGFNPPPPQSREFVRLFNSNPTDADLAWEAVRTTDLIADLAGGGAYRVVIFDHFYTIGAADPSTAEWVVVAFSRPPAPMDGALEAVVWPMNLLEPGACQNPEVRVRNFSDSPLTVAVDLRITGPGGFNYLARESAGAVPADQTKTMQFPELTPVGTGPFTLTAALVPENGGAWSDTWNDNDGQSALLGASDLPVFRGVSMSVNGSNPLVNATLVDFDGDGDLDIFQAAYASKLWRHNSDDTFTDITGTAGVSLPSWPRLALGGDWTGDGRPDLLVHDFGGTPQLLSGDGAGHFVDVSAAAGLTTVTAPLYLARIDLEGDADSDLLLAGPTAKTLLRNDGAGHFTNVTAGAGISDAGQTNNFVVGDLSGDGIDDFFLVNWGFPSRLYLNDGVGHFTERPGPWSMTYARGGLIFDENSDGLQDLLVTYETGCRLFRNGPGLVFADVTVATGMTPGAFVAAATDLDGDGRPEVALGNLSQLLLLHRTATGFVDRSAVLITPGGSTGANSFGFFDFMGDGDLDLATGSGVREQVGGECAVSGVIDPSLPPAVIVSAPNPFRPARGPTRFFYRAEGGGRFTVAIHDLQGRLVRSWSEEPTDSVAGLSVAQWDGRDDAGRLVPSGLYFVRMTGETARSFGKTLVVR